MVENKSISKCNNVLLFKKKKPKHFTFLFKSKCTHFDNDIIDDNLT